MCFLALSGRIRLLTLPARMAIPIRKVRLSQDDLSKSIPMLSDRQFVVAQSGLTKEEERAQQELFWYREELLKSVQAKWHEVCDTTPCRFSNSRVLIDRRHTLRDAVFQNRENDAANVANLPS